MFAPVPFLLGFVAGIRTDAAAAVEGGRDVGSSVLISNVENAAPSAASSTDL